MRMARFISIWLALASLQTSTAWVAPSTSTTNNRIRSVDRTGIRSNTSLSLLLPSAAISLLAGSIAGAAGVGFAFPLDTLKTKQQVELETCSRIQYAVSPSGDLTITRAPASSMQTAISETLSAEGFAGFYHGVQTSMAGQALIKATAFSVNNAALHADYSLVAAAATAGLVTAFLAVPVDRIKVLMQTGSYDTEKECFQAVLELEGIKGLLTTGLVPTLFREVPAYTVSAQ